MNRKKFLSAALPLVTALTSYSISGTGNPIVLQKERLKINRLPPYLKKGDRIGITCPAGFILPEDIVSAVEKLQEWGFEVVLGNTIGKRDFTFGGTDEERKNDLQQMLDDKKLKAILCARGGYGAVRIVDDLNFKKFVAAPKWVIGFSDITILHNHINRNYGIATLHSKMCNSFPSDWTKAEPIQIETIESIRKCLVGEKMQYEALPNNNNKLGKATGILVGGNLKTIESLAGSKSDLNTAGKILFVEDTGEYLYSIDRMFWNLKRSGKLDKLAGLIIGGFKIKKEDTEAEAFGKTVEEIVMQKVMEFKYPVCFDFPVGHQKNNYALKCGVRHQLIIASTNSLLKEIQ
jgi:muramoyltetrapeptide carboxypeptidase